jgi:hypothetical protein
VAAFAWAAALVLAAFVAPVYGTSGASSSGATWSGSATLVGVNGTGVLIPVSVPAVLTLLVWGALHRRCSYGSRWATPAAWTAIGLLGAFCLLAIFSIGVLVAPVVGLLAAAAARTPLAGA